MTSWQPCPLPPRFLSPCSKRYRPSNAEGLYWKWRLSLYAMIHLYSWKVWNGLHGKVALQWLHSKGNLHFNFSVKKVFEVFCILWMPKWKAQGFHEVWAECFVKDIIKQPSERKNAGHYNNENNRNNQNNRNSQNKDYLKGCFASLFLNQHFGLPFAVKKLTDCPALSEKEEPSSMRSRASASCTSAS